MNNRELLISVMERSREFTALTDALSDARRRARQRPFAVNGLCEGASSVFTSCLAKSETEGGRRAMFIYPSETEAAAAAALLSEDGVPALFYPARDFDFSLATASRDYERERLSVLSQLLFSEESAAVCTTAEAALQVTVPPELLLHLTISVESDKSLDLERFSAALTQGGYTRVEMVEGAGQFAIRGGIADVFPPGASPYRIELFGDEIDRVAVFDTVTQRFTENVSGRLLIPPAREITADAETLSDIRESLNRRIARLQKKGGAEHTLQTLRRELEMLESGSPLESIDKYLPRIYPQAACLLDYFDGLYMLCDENAVRERCRAAAALLSESVAELAAAGELDGEGIFVNGFDRIEAALTAAPCVLLDSFSRTHPAIPCGAEFSFRTRHIPSFGGSFSLMKEDLSPMAENAYRVALLTSNETEARQVASQLCDEGISAGLYTGTTDFFTRGNNASGYPVAVLHGESMAGFELFGEKFALLDFSGSISGSRGGIRRGKKSKAAKKKTREILSYNDLETGDFVVHEAYGIGRFLGIENLTVGGISRDYVKIQYAGTDRLFLPVDQLDLVSKYIGAGAGTAEVKLSKMGGGDWTRAKTKASAQAKEMARELIQLYARRRRTPGYAFSPDDDMSRQFADAFEYEETDSQLTAINDVCRDMEASYPMDRIICGDVGYGKTEVALRAAFKAAKDGRQTAILVPTTILAMQHFRTAQSRFRGFPVTVDMLSRFRSRKEQEASLRRLKRGETDIIIGTHRIISHDVEFRDLGLVIIDEEQRFGVAQKEKLKELSVGADILTLTATPIPRTLNMAMGGILDMSLLDDVPGMRSPVQTYVTEHDEAMLLEAIRRELRRGGQVFYLNNDIEHIYTIASKLSREIPDARIAAAHGRMDREELEDIWAAMTSGEIDILVCTTIIETGVDIPNANTLIIENADRFGLSQLHQIRGRVGRSNRRAYAYLTYPKMKQLSEIADKRLQALREYAAFGAGFRIAMRDLEIRGAGNLLGGEQHGNMDSVGYDMYVKLLEDAVLEEKGETKAPRLECAVALTCDAFLPKSYIRDQTLRMEMYRKIARIRSEDDFSDIIDELCDRFGEPPRSAFNLCRIALIRGMGIECGFEKIEEREREICLCSPSPDLTAVQALSSLHPGAVRMTLGASCAITVKKARGQTSAEQILQLLTEYIQNFSQSV